MHHQRHQLCARRHSDNTTPVAHRNAGNVGTMVATRQRTAVRIARWAGAGLSAGAADLRTCAIRAEAGLTVRRGGIAGLSHHLAAEGRMRQIDDAVDHRHHRAGTGVPCRMRRGRANLRSRGGQRFFRQGLAVDVGHVRMRGERFDPGLVQLQRHARHEIEAGQVAPVFAAKMRRDDGQDAVLQGMHHARTCGVRQRLSSFGRQFRRGVQPDDDADRAFIGRGLAQQAQGNQGARAGLAVRGLGIDAGRELRRFSLGSADLARPRTQHADRERERINDLQRDVMVFRPVGVRVIPFDTPDCRPARQGSGIAARAATGFP